MFCNIQLQKPKSGKTINKLAINMFFFLSLFQYKKKEACIALTVVVNCCFFLNSQLSSRGQY